MAGVRFLLALICIILGFIAAFIGAKGLLMSPLEWYVAAISIELLGDFALPVVVRKTE